MILFVSDYFIEQYQGGAEKTSESIIRSSFFPVVKVPSASVTVGIMKQYKNAFWVFGNYSGLKPDAILYAVKHLDYSIVEYDYKFCKYRSIEKHIHLEGKCDCHQSKQGKLIALFLHHSRHNWWMSANQRKIHQDCFPFLKDEKNIVLTSNFLDETFDLIESLDISKKNNKWLILDSPSWIKGREEAISYAKENNLKYELVWGLEYEELLKKMASSKGVIFFPRGADTCPRFIIEAKLLGCELILNDNVQHKDEEWFLSDKEEIKKYLKKRPDFFWKRVEKDIADALQLPKDKVQSYNKYKIIVPFYNAEKWINKCIKSVKRQNHDNFKCILIDDMSTDNSTKVVENAIKGDDRFELIKNKEKKYALNNIVDAINLDSHPEDIIVLLDGDDWFASSYTLDRLNRAYESECLMTYGSYAYNPGGQRGVEPSEYPENVIKNNSFRQDIWRASHLRSFKNKLFSKLDLKDLQDESGKYFEMTYDQAIMLPLLEMSGDRSTYIPETLYVYNKENPLNVDKIKAQKQSELAQKIRKKQPYQKI